MNAKSTKATYTADREIVVIRTLNAPRELVFAALTDAEHIGEWYGPTGFSVTTASMDLRVGGVWRFTMHGPDGTDYPNRIIYTEVQAPARLAYKHDDDGKTGPDAIRFETVITLETVGARTKLTMRSVFETAEMRERVSRDFGAVEGGIQHLARFATYLAERHGGSTATLTVSLPTEREIILQRSFAAPRDLVFAALSQPEHIPHWWGCGTFTTTVEELDFRVGGRYRFVQRAPDGTVHPFCGEYREIVAPERIQQTFVYDVEHIRDHAALETMTLEEVDGATILTTRILHDSLESRDAQLHAGMTDGAATSFDRLQEHLLTLSPR